MLISKLLLLWNKNVQYTVSRLSVKYNLTDFSYLASDARFSDTGSFQTGANVVHIATVAGNNTPALDANTGLGYDDNTDRLIIKDARTAESRFFTRAAYITAAGAAAGTLPVFDLQVAGDGGQGVTFDPINNHIFEWTTPDNIRETDTSNNEIDDFSVPGGASISMLFYDPVTRSIYGASDSGNYVYTLRKVSGTWTLVATSWYTSTEGQSLDYIFDKMVTNGARIREQDPVTGLNVVMYPYPTTTTGSVQEGFWVDIKDGTFWFNSDEWWHGGITNGNRLWHTDPRKLYRKYYRFPDMDTWSDLWKLNSNQAVGRLNGQHLIGGNFSTGPVMDFGAHTGQQTLANWELGDGEQADLEFRGSASAPTTTPEATRDYHTLVLYDANGTNDGWGATTPGAWQSTPTTDRYMQVRLRPKPYVAPTQITTPLDLGSSLKAWYPCYKNTGILENEFFGMYVDVYDSYRVVQMTDVKAALAGQIPNNFTQVTTTQRPVWSTSYVDARGGNRNLLITSVADWLTMAGTDVEIHIIFRKPAAANRAIPLSITQSSTNNSRFVFQHLGSAGTVPNLLGYEYVDAAGVSNVVGIVDTSWGTFRVVSYRLGTGGNKLYVNGVEQTLTVYSGANTGQSLNLITATSNNVRLGRIQSSTSVQGTTDWLEFGLTGHLSDADRQEYIVDYATAKGLI